MFQSCQFYNDNVVEILWIYYIFYRIIWNFYYFLQVVVCFFVFYNVYCKGGYNLNNMYGLDFVYKYYNMFFCFVFYLLVGLLLLRNEDYFMILNDELNK